MHVGVQNDPRRHGWVQLTLRSKGFTRSHCSSTVRFVFHNTVAPFNHERYFTVSGTRRPGSVLAKKKIWIGSGLDLLSVTTIHPASKGVSYYVALP